MELNKEYQIENTSLGGSCDEEERVPKKALEGYIEMRRTDGTSTRKMVR
jgi:hypothetical protein